MRVAAIVACLFGLLLSASGASAARYGAHRVGGHGPHGKGSHYVGGHKTTAVGRFMRRHL